MPGRIRRRQLAGALAGWLAATGFPAAGASPLPALVASVRGSVVAIGTYSATDSPRFTFRGTGFAVGDGSTIVTNGHVLPPTELATAPTLMALLPRRDGGEPEPRRLQVTALDRAHDLALLRIEGDRLPPLALQPETAPEGTAVALLGFPIGGLFGYSLVTHRGIVSSVTRIALPAPTAQQLSARALAQLREGAFEVYQLDATAFPGNSGGPLLDVDTGKVVGIVNMVLVRGTRESALSAPTGITYAIPSRHIAALLERR